MERFGGPQPGQTVENLPKGFILIDDMLRPSSLLGLVAPVICPQSPPCHIPSLVLYGHELGEGIVLVKIHCWCAFCPPRWHALLGAGLLKSVDLMGEGQAPKPVGFLR